MKVAIIDPGLLTRVGHHYNYDLAVTAELTRRNIKSVVYAYSGAAREVLGDFSVKPVFRDYLYNSASNDPYETCRTLESFFTKNTILYQDLVQYLPHKSLSKSDIVLFHTINQNGLFGVLQWLAGFQPAQRPLVVICFQINLQDDPELLIPSLYRFALKGLSAHYPRIVFSACSEELASVCGRIGGVAVETVPYPVDPCARGTNAPPADAVATGKRLRVAYLGHSVPRRGVELLSGIVAAALAKGLDVEFLVQLTNPDIPVIADIGKVLAGYGDRVHVVYGDLSEEDYFAYLRTAAIVLLPYSREHYAYCHSGAFSDAMGLGKVIVCPDDTWMARQMVAFDAGGGSFDVCTPDAIVDALARLAPRYGLLQTKAQAAAVRWRARHNAAGLVDRILEFAAR